MRFRPSILAAAAASTLFATVAVASMASTATASTGGRSATARTTAAASGTEIAVKDGTFGPMLVVGKGPGQGTALYAITSDFGGKYGCTTKEVNVVGQNLMCTGPTGNSMVEWPALTTAAKPIAGTGVNAKLLGEVYRKGIGEQVTYNGHPLYLFDEIPGILTGENWDEATIPPWHGVWELISPAGNFQAPAQTLTTTVTTKGKTVLAAVMEVDGGQIGFPLYWLSKAPLCAGSCIRTWVPLLTTGTPGLLNGLAAANVGSVELKNGTHQLTYKGKRLYLYGDEAVSLSTGWPIPYGNGNGVAAPTGTTGTFHLVLP